MLQLCIQNNFCVISVSPGTYEKVFLKLAAETNFYLSLETNVYCVRNDSDRLSLWESYSVKGISVIQMIQGVVDEGNLFNHLFQTKYYWRSNFQGVTITANAVVLYSGI